MLLPNYLCMRCRANPSNGVTWKSITCNGLCQQNKPSKLNNILCDSPASGRRHCRVKTVFFRKLSLSFSLVPFNLTLSSFYRSECFTFVVFYGCIQALSAWNLQVPVILVFIDWALLKRHFYRRLSGHHVNPWKGWHQMEVERGIIRCVVEHQQLEIWVAGQKGILLGGRNPLKNIPKTLWNSFFPVSRQCFRTLRILCFEWFMFKE